MNTKKLLLLIPFLLLSLNYKNNNQTNEMSYPKITNPQQYEIKIPGKYTQFEFQNKIINPIITDSTFLKEKYLIGLENEIKFWYKVFTTTKDSTIIINRQTFEILGYIKTPNIDNLEQNEIKKIDIAIIDSVHIANGYKPQKRKSKRKFGIVYGKKEMIQESIERGSWLLENYIQVLEKNNMPTSLAIKPVYESSFRTDAGSWANAIGLFQFIKQTGKRHGLDVKRGLDERKGFFKPLDAYISYMQDCFEKFDDKKGLALVAYNVGYNSKKFKNFKTKNEIEIIQNMGFAPRSYLPEHIAIQQIFNNLFRIFPDIYLKENTNNIITIDSVIKAKDLPHFLKTSIKDIISKNPQYSEKFFNTNYKIKEGTLILK